MELILGKEWQIKCDRFDGINLYWINCPDVGWSGKGILHPKTRQWEDSLKVDEAFKSEAEAQAFVDSFFVKEPNPADLAEELLLLTEEDCR